MRIVRTPRRPLDHCGRSLGPPHPSLSIYGFAVFGFITASFASFFIERDAVSENTEILGTKDLAALREEIAGLREALNRGR